MSIKNIHRNSFSDTPTTIKRKVDNNLYDIKKAYTKINGNVVLVWDITENNKLIIKLERIDSNYNMSLSLDFTFTFNDGTVSFTDSANNFDFKDISTSSFTSYVGNYSVDKNVVTFESSNGYGLIDVDGRELEGLNNIFKTVGNAYVDITFPDSILAFNNLLFRNYCPTSFRRVNLGESLKVIPASAFFNCTNLEDIYIPNTVETIYSTAFGNCTSLQKIRLPKSLQIIEYDLFSNCILLSNVIIQENVHTIRGGAFMGCTSLKNLTIPIGVKKFGDGSVFYDNLKTINYAGTIADWNAIEKGEFFWSRNIQGVSHSVICTDGIIDYST